MYEEELLEHEILFSGPSWKLGLIHWYILKASTEMHSKCWVKNDDKWSTLRSTEFGDEVGSDEANWWIFKKETELQAFKERTNEALQAAQTLKKASSELKISFYDSKPDSYSQIIKTIKQFTKNYEREIETLHDYVAWLYQKNPLAPTILFNYTVWGSTRMGDRSFTIKENEVKKDSVEVRLCTEIALGLRERLIATLESTHIDLLDGIASNTDPSQYSGPIVVSKARLAERASHKIMDEMAAYFEFIRNALRNIESEIEKFNAQTVLLYSGQFWEKFTKKAMNIRTENQLWDFKETFAMWKDKNKQGLKVEFCEDIAAFANACGGAVIIGISDKMPREIIGIGDPESKIKSITSAIRRYVKYDDEFTKAIPLEMDDDNGVKKTIIVIAIAQSKAAVSIKDEAGKFSYPVRSGTGKENSDLEKIERSKRFIHRDNYNFILEMEKLIYTQ